MRLGQVIRMSRLLQTEKKEYMKLSHKMTSCHKYNQTELSAWKINARQKAHCNISFEIRSNLNYRDKIKSTSDDCNLPKIHKRKKKIHQSLQLLPPRPISYRFEHARICCINIKQRHELLPPSSTTAVPHPSLEVSDLG